MSKKKKVVLAARLDSLLQKTCMALFLNIFIVTSNSPVSIYRSICSCSHCFSGLLQGTTCGKADHPWQPYLVRGDHLRQHNLPQMVRGDQLWRGTNCGVTALMHLSMLCPTTPHPGNVGDLDFSKFKCTTHWARQSVKSQPSPYSIIEEKMGNLIVGAFNCSTCIW